MYARREISAAGKLEGQSHANQGVDISNPISPKAIAEITPIPIPRWGFPYVVNYQVIGNKLYALDLNGVAVVFNFDRTRAISANGDMWPRTRLKAIQLSPSRPTVPTSTLRIFTTI